MIALTLFLILLMSIVYKYLLRPYILYRKYKKYGDGFFFPYFGESVEFENNFNKYGDCEYSFKHFFDKREPSQNRIHVGIMGSSVKVRLLDPDLIKEFHQKSENYQIDDFFECNLQRFFGQGFSEKDPKMHRSLRKMYAPAFHFEYLQNLSSSVEQITKNVINDYIINNNLTKLNPIHITNNIASQVLFLSFFGETLHELRFREIKLPEALAYVLFGLCQQMTEYGFFLFGPAYLKKGYFKDHKNLEDFQQAFKKYLSEVLNERVQKYMSEYKQTGSIQQHCILSILIKNNHIDQIPPDRLLEHFLSFFLAGMETTSNLVGMTIYYTALNKDIYKTLQQEIDQNSDQSALGLSNLPYLNAVIKETLRYYGPANSLFDRIAIKDHYLNDIKIEKGVKVNVQMTTVHRDPRFYKNPHTYDPQRWLESKENKPLEPYTFLPFSSGPKQCIGQHLGLMETKIILNFFLKQFDYEIEKGYNLQMDFKFSPQPLEPLQINFKLR